MFAQHLRAGPSYVSLVACFPSILGRSQVRVLIYVPRYHSPLLIDEYHWLIDFIQAYHTGCKYSLDYNV